MATAEEYRQFERTCLRWAADARSEEKRHAYQELAKTYNMGGRIGAELEAARSSSPRRDRMSYPGTINSGWFSAAVA
jgi:hypothetical protein